jgi:eukaryotic-like serine/threonine-protein kinase
MNVTPEREAAIFNAARKLPVGERAFYLDGACAGDAPLRRRVEELLQASEEAAGFLPELATGAEASPPAGATPGPSVPSRVAPSPSEQPGDTIDRYKLMEKIGEGGFGVVYVAEQKEPVKRRVALKIIKLGMDTKAVVARFAAERQALALMDHPNIAKVLDAGTTSTGRPFFVMELVKGIKLTDYCNQHKLPTRARLDLFMQACRAIQHAHQKGIIHRDIKPSNILVTLHDGVPLPKVIDFGIAKATQGDLTDQTVYTQYQQFIGTPAYMSPEQAETSGLDIDTRSDIYSLGVLLYELLTGKTPFDSKELLASGLDAMRHTIREKEPVRPSTCLATLGAKELTTTASQRSSDRSNLLHQLKGDLDWIVMKALEKDRNRRYDTANALAADVGRYLSDEPVVARPPSAGYRFQKAFRRNRLVFTATAGVILALVVGLAVSSWLYRQERSALVSADLAREVAKSALKDQTKLLEEANLETKMVEIQAATTSTNFAKAQALLDQIPLDSLREYLRAHKTFVLLYDIGMIGDWHAREGRYQAALEVLRLLDEVFPSDDMVDAEGIIHVAISSLLVQTGKMEDYRRFCQEAVRRFSEAKEPRLANAIALGALILPGSGIDLQVVAKMADRAVASTNRATLMPLFEVTKALSEYRRGRFAGAIEWSRRFLTVPLEGELRCFTAEAYLVLAMAQCRLAHAEEARSAFAEGGEIVETQIGKGTSRGPDQVQWPDWIIARALLREAGALIEEPPGTPGKEQPQR